MDTIVITRTFEGDLESMVAFARSLQSRINWPGSVLQYEGRGIICYGVGMRLKAATMTDITVEETLSDVERDDNGDVWFSTVNKALWPDGHMTVLAEYRFSPGDDGDPNTLRFAYSFPPPSSKLVKPKQLPAFHVAMEKVCSRYIKGLLAEGSSASTAPARTVSPAPLDVPAQSIPATASPSTASPSTASPSTASPSTASPSTASPSTGAPQTPAAAAVPTPAPTPVSAASAAAAGAPPNYDLPGMSTVVVSQEFTGDLPSFVEFTRSLKSRGYWPGAVPEYEQPDMLYFGIGMRLEAATITDITVEERLGDVTELEGGVVRYSTSHRMLWPDGHIDAISEYLFIPGSGGAPNVVRFTYSYPPPSTKLVKTKELPAFRAAMEKVITRYLERIATAAG